MVVSLTGADTLILDGRVLADLADGDTAALEFANDLVGMKTGKNGNALYAKNATGQNGALTLRVIRGSADDKYLNSRMSEYIQDSAAFTLIEGEFVKRAGDGDGNVTNDKYKCDGGVIQKIPGAKENQEGDIEQSVTIWQIMFARVRRIMA